MIEDSYSRSHTGRAEINPDGKSGPYRPVVDCEPVQAFYDYGVNKPRHPKADKFPEFAPSCQAGRAVLDPITAGARMIDFIAKGDDTARAAAVALVMNDVLGSPPS
jgi:hypothetical protein